MSDKGFSKKDALLEHLLNGHPITVMESIVLFGVPSLTKEIADFKRSGWIVKRQTVPFARVVKRVNQFATLVPPDSLDVQSMKLSEWWISQ
jgi:hypothetical protein